MERVPGGGRLRVAARVAGSVLGVALLACAVALGGCGGGSAEAGIGEPASNTEVSVTVHSVKVVRVITMEDGRLSRVGDNGVYVIADMTIENLSDTVHKVDTDNVHIVMGEDYWLADDDLAYDAEAPGELKPLRSGALKPGKHVRGQVLIRVPQKTLDSLVYSVEPEDIVIGLDGMKAKAPRATPAPRLGQTAKAGGLALTVHSVSYPSQLYRDGWVYTATSGHKLAVLNVTVKNLDRTPSYRIDPEALGIVDAKGTTWQPYNRVHPGLAESAQLPMKSLKPGSQAKGKVVINVSAKVKLKRIRYEVGVLGPPLEVRLTK